MINFMYEDLVERIKNLNNNIDKLSNRYKAAILRGIADDLYDVLGLSVYDIFLKLHTIADKLSKFTETEIPTDTMKRVHQ